MDNTKQTYTFLFLKKLLLVYIQISYFITSTIQFMQYKKKLFNEGNDNVCS